MFNRINYIGHSAFYIESQNSGILVDPFITNNPNAKFDFTKKIDDIFVTHGHDDHIGDAIPLSCKRKIPITAVFELAKYCAQKGAIVNGVNIGGKVNYNWGSAKFLPAFHSSSTQDNTYAGTPMSILFDINGTKIYHAGDTCLNSEMKVIGEIYKPDIAILPVGSQYTMDIDDAVIAAQWLNAKKIIPMHYNTFSAISVNINDFKNKIENIGKDAIILNSGESVDF